MIISSCHRIIMECHFVLSCEDHGMSFLVMEDHGMSIHVVMRRSWNAISCHGKIVECNFPTW